MGAILACTCTCTCTWTCSNSRPQAHLCTRSSSRRATSSARFASRAWLSATRCAIAAAFAAAVTCALAFCVAMKRRSACALSAASLSTFWRIARRSSSVSGRLDGGTALVRPSSGSAGGFGGLGFAASGACGKWRLSITHAFFAAKASDDSAAAAAADELGSRGP